MKRVYDMDGPSHTTAWALLKAYAPKTQLEAI